MAYTKDENFMIKLYEETLKQKDQEEPLDRYAIGQMVGLKKLAVDTICTLLGQANFIKKHGDTGITITHQGVRLINDIKEKK
ncbi:MAG: hypothetical protein H0W88_07005 [Parachlamydiaceae bacterium]|nr:hypothetical protein [Parachlamydiaceae bacterium]